MSSNKQVRPRGSRGRFVSRIAVENRKCDMCSRTDTTQWRSGLNGQSLCNACGIRLTRKNLTAATASHGSPRPARNPIAKRRHVPSGSGVTIDSPPTEMSIPHSSRGSSQPRTGSSSDPRAHWESLGDASSHGDRGRSAAVSVDTNGSLRYGHSDMHSSLYGDGTSVVLPRSSNAIDSTSVHPSINLDKSWKAKVSSQSERKTGRSDAYSLKTILN